MASKRLVLCLEGTWNNAYKMRERDDGSKVIKPANPLKLARSVLSWDDAQKIQQITYYDTGVGALGTYPGLSNRIIGFVDSKLGGGWGAGFEANVEQAATFLVHNYSPGDPVFIFGFSRGAAQARGLTRFLDWMGGIPAKGDAYFVPLFYQHYIRTSGTGDPADAKTSTGRGPDEPMVPVTVEMLGVWDTVMALGSRFRAKRGTSVLSRSFHVGDKPAKCVKHARHALAVDERRYDFRPEIWLSCHENQTLEQRWFPGVHSNVGGGYVRDGLANIGFHWLLNEANRFGLATDDEFASFYRCYPQACLYDSWTIFYRILDFVRFRYRRGIRKLTKYKQEANLVLDKSVIKRIQSNADEHNQLQTYRPENVLEFLSTHKGDLANYLRSIGMDETELDLPQDVLDGL